jgi:ureidoglycolate hydrolase
MSQPNTILQKLPAQPITPEAFRPYGKVIFATEDGQEYGSEDAQLHLHNGIPRFYIMRLHQRGRRFHKITRHALCTQCLGSLEGKDWFLGVAPPSAAEAPNWQEIKIFHIPGNCFVQLHLKTWHAGPYFDHPSVDFYNLELSNTNIADHDTCNLRDRFGVEFEIESPAID